MFLYEGQTVSTFKAQPYVLSFLVSTGISDLKECLSDSPISTAEVSLDRKCKYFANCFRYISSENVKHSLPPAFN